MGTGLQETQGAEEREPNAQKKRQRKKKKSRRKKRDTERTLDPEGVSTPMPLDPEGVVLLRPRVFRGTSQPRKTRRESSDSSKQEDTEATLNPQRVFTTDSLDPEGVGLLQRVSVSQSSRTAQERDLCDLRVLGELEKVETSQDNAHTFAYVGHDTGPVGGSHAACHSLRMFRGLPQVEGLTGGDGLRTNHSSWRRSGG